MKDYLFRKNLSVKQLAGDLNISTSYLYQLIRGERKPSIELAQRIEEYTDGEVTIGKLLGLEGEEVSSCALGNSFASQSKEYEQRFSSLENASEKFGEKLEEIEGRLIKLEQGDDTI